jgi:hypothetical protein
MSILKRYFRYFSWSWCRKQTLPLLYNIQQKNESTERPSDRPTYRPTDRPTIQPTNQPTDKTTNQTTSQPIPRNQSSLRLWVWPVLLAFGRYPAGHAWQVVSSRRNSSKAQATQTQQHFCSCPPVWKFWNPKCQRLSKTWGSHGDDSDGVYITSTYQIETFIRRR